MAVVGNDLRAQGGHVGISESLVLLKLVKVEQDVAGLIIPQDDDRPLLVDHTGDSGEVLVGLGHRDQVRGVNEHNVLL